LRECVAQLKKYFEGTLREFTVNTEQSGTDFQKLVWKKISMIPFGRTASYLDVARSLGNENALRAVGNANGRNRIPVIVPCHRVVGANDSLTGYAGGLWRKQWLLDHERAVAHGVRKMF
jgi:methylated-DNA-[protein]-cysteine S-methyltransferase